MNLKASVLVNGEKVNLLTAGALWLAATETLVVSDLHLEKGSNYAARGALLPPYDTRTTLRRVAGLMKSLKPRRVISLGDAFHDGGAEARMDEEDAALLSSLAAAAAWIWVLGNHDPEPPARFSGSVEIAVRIGALLFRHEPQLRAEAGEIAGHLHPVARVRTQSRTLRRRCFATDGARLVMPAFGAYAGGLNVRDEAFEPLFNDLTAYVLGGDGVYPFWGAALAPDPRDAFPFRQTG
ncbi:MAG: ligase-associated DNA damage response endonuclease PdeM [Parvularculaceae bacterium]|nr:ligase-associated DNA damage response endonuclease PdeM [Parvularculaceae bacterium]